MPTRHETLQKIAETLETLIGAAKSEQFTLLEYLLEESRIEALYLLSGGEERESFRVKH